MSPKQNVIKEKKNNNKTKRDVKTVNVNKSSFSIPISVVLPNNFVNTPSNRAVCNVKIENINSQELKMFRYLTILVKKEIIILVYLLKEKLIMTNLDLLQQQL